MNPAFRVLQVILVLSIFISVTFAQEVNNKKESNKVENSGAIKDINTPQAGGDKIIFRDGTTPLLDIENLDEAGALILYDATVTGGGTGKYLQNNGGNLLWGGQQLGLASGGVSKIDDLSDAIYVRSSLYLGQGSGSSDNIATGHFFNTALGQNSLKVLTLGQFNVAVGIEALENSNGHNNTAVGSQSLRNNNSGIDNTALGAFTLNGNNGSRNVALGNNALRNSSSGSDNIAIGHNAGENETGSNKLYIENSNSATPLIYGEFDNDLVKINGQLLVTNRSGFGALESIASLNVRGISGDLIAFRVEEPGGSPKFQVSNDGHVGINQWYSNTTMNVRGISGDITYFTVEDPTGGIFFDVFPSGNAQFYNALTVNGNLSKGGGSFKIDHPLDPTNKNLYHSFVESPDMMNVYNGNVTLDGNGEATVTMADWFEALNKDYRYQLTAIGAPGPNLYIADKIIGNQFRIAGGTPGMEVSWQVTGVRQDAYANENRIKVEELKKPEERGKYLHPTAFGQPKEMGISHSEELKRQEINTQN